MNGHTLKFYFSVKWKVRELCITQGFTLGVKGLIFKFQCSEQCFVCMGHYKLSEKEILQMNISLLRFLSRWLFANIVMELKLKIQSHLSQGGF